MPLTIAQSRSLTAYRIIAYVVGVALLTAVSATVAEAVGSGDDAVTGAIWTVHGFLFILYALLALNLAVTRRWGLGRTILVVVSGTIPFLSFVMERQVTAQVRDGVA